MATGRLPDPNTAPLTAKGDLYTYSTAPARLAVGSDGETLVADSSTSTGLRWQGNFAAGKNKIINGDFGIWQRGTSTTVTANTTSFVTDRWRLNVDNSSGGSAVVTRQTFTPGTAPVAGYEGIYFCRIANTAGSTASRYFWQTIEDVQTFAGQTVTFSFFARATSATNIDVKFQQNFGSGGSSPVNGTFNAATALTTSWQRFSYSVTLPSIAGKTIGSSSYLYVLFEWLNTVSTTIEIWGVQLEAGSVATPFTTATGTLAGELAACQRYYYRQNAPDAYSNFGTGFAVNTTTSRITISLPVTMRTKISTTVDSANLALYDGLSITALTSLTVAENNTQTPSLNAGVAAGLTANRPYSLIANNSTSAYVGVSAEL